LLGQISAIWPNRSPVAGHNLGRPFWTNRKHCFCPKSPKSDFASRSERRK
jgi:hypothetical protein